MTRYSLSQTSLVRSEHLARSSWYQNQLFMTGIFMLGQVRPQCPLCVMEWGQEGSQLRVL